MDKYTIYGKDNCKFCIMSKRLLEAKNLQYDEVKIPDDIDVETLKDRIKSLGVDKKISSVPQIVYGNTYIGGFNDLKTFLNFENA